jgi:hypothetical protein
MHSRDREPQDPATGTRADTPPQMRSKHPEEWEGDLNPDRKAGQNIGSPHGEGETTAYDYKDLHNTLQEFDDSELRQIRVVPPGERLQQGGTYLDLGNRERGEFTATGEMAAGERDRIVPKSEVPYSLWNRLRGVDEGERDVERGRSGA